MISEQRLLPSSSYTGFSRLSTSNCSCSFKSEHSCFTTSCQVSAAQQSESPSMGGGGGARVHACVCVPLLSGFQSTEFPVLHSRFLSANYFIHEINSVYVSIISQFILLTPLPLVSTFVLSVCISVSALQIRPYILFF